MKMVAAMLLYGVMTAYAFATVLGGARFILFVGDGDSAWQNIRRFLYVPISLMLLASVLLGEVGRGGLVIIGKANYLDCLLITLQYAADVLSLGFISIFGVNFTPNLAVQPGWYASSFILYSLQATLSMCFFTTLALLIKIYAPRVRP